MNKQVVSFRSLIDEMQSVAQGHRSAVVRKDRTAYASQAARTFAQKIQGHDGDASKPESDQAALNITSLAGVTRLISRDNQQLLQIIAQGDVTSLADLARKTKTSADQTHDGVLGADYAGSIAAGRFTDGYLLSVCRHIGCGWCNSR